MKTICGCEIAKKWRQVEGITGAPYVAECEHGLYWTAVGGDDNLIRWEGNECRKIVCLCGSTRFSEAFQAANLDETLKGNIVLKSNIILTVGCDTKGDDKLFCDMPADDLASLKKRLDILHFRKIDLADEILILNVGGYIGESTGRELAYAKAMEKKIRFLEGGDSMNK